MLYCQKATSYRKEDGLFYNAMQPAKAQVYLEVHLGEGCEAAPVNVAAGDAPQLRDGAQHTLADAELGTVEAEVQLRQAGEEEE